jgi:hypothetical protein
MLTKWKKEEERLVERNKDEEESEVKVANSSNVLKV